jgi:hypothetical protein
LADLLTVGIQAPDRRDGQDCLESAVNLGLSAPAGLSDSFERVHAQDQSLLQCRLNGAR